MRIYNRRQRRGSIAVFALVVLIIFFAMLAFSLDIGYIQVTRTELQRAADSAATAAAWELINEDVASGSANPSVATENARDAAEQYAAYNQVLGDEPALSESDVQIGYLADPTDPDEQLDTSGANPPNAVRVLVRRTAEQNGEIPLLFAQMLGTDSARRNAHATAAFVSNFVGFRAPTDGSNLGMLPFTLDIDTWNDMLDGNASDNWTWNAETGEIESGADGILEVNLFPQSTGSPGNRGTIDIGSNNNSTADIARQITDGVSPADLAYHDGKLELNDAGELFLNGDTGISAGVKDELVSIKGEPKVIPIFTQVNGPGNNATYTIVKFVGIRIMDVKLTGNMNGKRVIIQPASMVSKGGIPSTDGEQTTYYIYSAPWLVR
jgi:hypothetical protein